MVGCINASGLAFNLSLALTRLGANNVLFLLVCAAVASLILGMGICRSSDRRTPAARPQTGTGSAPGSPSSAPALIMIGSAGAIIMDAILCAYAIFGVCIALSGYWQRSVPMAIRLAICARGAGQAHLPAHGAGALHQQGLCAGPGGADGRGGARCARAVR